MISQFWFWRFLRRSFQDIEVDNVNSRMAIMDRMAADMATRCELCAGTAIYICPRCHRPIDSHTHENDYMCDIHGCVNPIRKPDGGTRLLVVRRDAPLTHREHGPIGIAPGGYRVIRQREYSPEAIRNIAD